MKIKRSWAADIEVADYWKEPQSLAKHRIYMCFNDPHFIKTDENGYRIPFGFKSLIEKYYNSRRKVNIFCFGGSTTFGAYCNYEESYPSYLESLNNDYNVFNIGLPGADLKNSFYTLLYFIRLGIIPDTAIFLDGINEKQAWFQAMNNNNYYEELDYQYHPFLRIIQKINSIDSLYKYIKFLIKKPSFEQKKNSKDFDFLRFVDGQSKSYIKSKNVIESIANHWDFDTLFFLQPTVFDFIKDGILDNESNSRYKYLKTLYKSIINNSDNSVNDISSGININPEMFIDWQHCNGAGNRIIAKKIFSFLK
tara:strand:+ start:163 stop:1086 length:924 start_codon:yes stop_codon:yes gene_type:complete